MPTIDVEILPGQFVPFEIRGEKPNYIEMQQINKLAKQAERSSLQQNQAAQAAQQEQLFDTETGVKSGSLRAVLSMAETAEEEDAKLTELFGMSKDTDFLRDNRGRLALTPEGGQKVGVDLAQNTLIDEEGLS